MSTNELPEHWVKTSLSEICMLNLKVKLEDDLDVGFMPMADMPTSYFGKTTYEIRKWEKVKKGYTQFKNNDILFAKITPCFENSKAAVVSEFPNEWGAGSTEYYVLRPIDQLVDSRLLFALVKTKDFLVNGAANMSGSVGHRRVTKEFVENYTFPLMPLAEQKQIAAKLDELLVQVDTLKTRLDSIPTILKHFRKSVLYAAVSGRLTEEWRRNNGIEYNSESCLKELGTISGGKTPSKSNPEYWKNGTIPWVSPKDMKVFEIKSSKDMITKLALSHSGMKLVPTESILMVTRSGILAHSFPVAMNLTEITINQDIKSFTPNSKKFRSKFALILMRGLEQRVLTECSKTGTTVASVETKLLENLKFTLPTLQEQDEIINKIYQFFTLVEQIEKRVENAQSKVNHLTQSILAKAFRGELTAEWREQNPDLISGENSAEVLLEKIKVERELITPKKRTTRKKREGIDDHFGYI